MRERPHGNVDISVELDRQHSDLRRDNARESAWKRSRPAGSTVCRVLGAPRSTVYGRAARETSVEAPAKRGPPTSLSDDELLEKIREVIRSSPFAGEGHRKVTARLRREHGIGVGRKRVLRLMRQAGLLAPQRTRGRRRPRAHTGRWTKGRTPEQVIGKRKMWSR